MKFLRVQYKKVNVLFFKFFFYYHHFNKFSKILSSLYIEKPKNMSSFDIFISLSFRILKIQNAKSKSVLANNSEHYRNN